MPMTEVITLPKHKYFRLLEENKVLRKTKLYRRLLEFEQNIQTGKIFTRKDLGF